MAPTLGQTQAGQGVGTHHAHARRRTLQRLQKRLTLSQIQDGHMSKTQGSWSENIILPVLLASSVAYGTDGKAGGNKHTGTAVQQVIP